MGFAGGEGWEIGVVEGGCDHGVTVVDGCGDARGVQGKMEGRVT